MCMCACAQGPVCKVSCFQFGVQLVLVHDPKLIKEVIGPLVLDGSVGKSKFYKEQYKVSVCPRVPQVVWLAAGFTFCVILLAGTVRLGHLWHKSARVF